MNTERRQVVVIGAGPAGAIAAGLLARRGRDVLVLERQRFPRFSIGESLLVHCLDFVAEAGMIDAVEAGGFQLKDGAAFARSDQYGAFDFSDRLTPGRATTFQVERARFDKVLADEAGRLGAEMRYEQEITAVESGAGRLRLTSKSAAGEVREIEADFALDASGFGRTLSRLLDLEQPSDFPGRHALFTHVGDPNPAPGYDRQKVLVTIHPLHHDVWYWLIPLGNGRCSIGTAARREFIARYPGTPAEKLKALLAEDPVLSRHLRDAVWDTQVRELAGYAASVRAMHGPGFALLGNAAEFLDPVFSSGVTIAMRGASEAAHALDRQLAGESVDWTRDFEQPLRKGIACFRAYVEAWYDGRFQHIAFAPYQQPDIRRMVCAILAGYAWDESNPFVADPVRRLDLLSELCRRQSA